MAIDPTRSSSIRARAAEAAAELNKRAPAKSTDPSGERRDQVEISDAGRALAEQAELDAVPSNQAKLAEVQERLENGFYDQPAVAADIARRIIEADDL